MTTHSRVHLVDATADGVHPGVDRVSLNRLSDVPTNRRVVERIVLIEINVVAVVAINVITLQAKVRLLLSSNFFSDMQVRTDSPDTGASRHNITSKLTT